MDVIVEEQEFAESKAAAQQNAGGTAPSQAAPVSEDPGDGFMNIPDGIDDELPFV